MANLKRFRLTRKRSAYAIRLQRDQKGVRLLDWAGEYQLELPDPGLERTYTLEIQASMPTYQMVWVILLTILGAAALIVGIVVLIQSVLYESRSLP